MWQFALLCLAELVLCVLLLILIQKMNQMKKQVSHIVKEVEGYIAFITEEADEVEEKEVFSEKMQRNFASDNLEEAQTHLIQSVLSEYFP